ncbi:MAG TPA: hypothetical protein VK154_16000, partial [Chitinophagales bacterium]|nr:hypothetical protein [Chitinophagales bacterium]
MPSVMINSVRNSWKLNTDAGRQRWVFDGNTEETEHLAQAFKYDKKENPNSGDRVYRTQKTAELPLLNPSDVPFHDGLKDNISTKAFHSAYKGIHFYKHLQADEGHWPGD